MNGKVNNKVNGKTNVKANEARKLPRPTRGASPGAFPTAGLLRREGFGAKVAALAGGPELAFHWATDIHAVEDVKVYLSRNPRATIVDVLGFVQREWGWLLELPHAHDRLMRLVIASGPVSQEQLLN